MNKNISAITIRPFFLTLIMGLLLLSTAAFAQNNDAPLVNIRLLAERAAVQPGDEIWVAMEQIIEPHWHTYWQNPGDSGTPTAIAWDLPEGFEISDLHWPAGERISYGTLLNYGYEERVVLLQKLKIPQNIPPGEITLSADIELLVCKEECIPEYGTYTLSLNGANAAEENNSALIEMARKTLPTQTSWTVEYAGDEENFSLTFADIPADILNTLDTNTIELLPIDWGMVSNSAKAQSQIIDNLITLSQKRGERALTDLEHFNGVLKATSETGEVQSFAFQARPAGIAPAKNAESTPQTSENISFIQALLFALIGGLILNLMPCVFPVLSIKALSLCKCAEKDPTHARILGLSYTAGVILSFVGIAALLIILKAGGEQIGWGFQLQNPIVVGLLAYLLFVLGLNLSGFFEFANPFANAGGALTQKDGASGSFFTGILATLVATPCTAPFMASALGYALVQPAYVSLTIFAALGLGLALPYLALSFIPSLQKALPKPGPWMDIFKQALAFPMYAAALWLIWVLGQQAGYNGMTAGLLGMLAITFAIWLYKHAPKAKTGKHIITAISAVLIITAAFILPQSATPIEKAHLEKATTSHEQQAFGEDFSQDKLDTLLASSPHPVFVEMTAAWCITCKVNNATSINIDSTKQAFAANDVQYLIGDWTNQDAEITRYLNQYDRNGVPIYVYYGPVNAEIGKRPAPKVLPQILTPQIITGLF